MFETIVVGVDGREGGRDALALAGLLQRTVGSKVVAVHAYPHEFFVSGGRNGDPEALMHGHAQGKLDAEVEAADVKAVATAVPDWSPARALHLAAKRYRAELMVVGSDHRSPAGRVFAGDVAHGTLNGAEVPVAVAPRGFAQAAAGLHTVAIGFDGSAESRAALDLARRLAEPAGARIELRCVVPHVGSGWPFAPGYSRLEKDADKLHAEAEEIVATALQELGPAATGKVVEGAIAPELTDLSRRVDLLVVGSRSYGPMRRHLLGSTSRKLMRSSLCPVLVIPRTAIEEHAEGTARSPEAAEITG